MTAPSRGPPGKRIAGLDGLRAVAVGLVLVGHAAATVPVPGRAAALVPYLGNAGLGVTTFFVISGFLITHLLREEMAWTGTVGLRAFYLRRLLRIFPAFYTYLLVIVALRVAGRIDTTPDDVAAAGTFLLNYKHCLPLTTSDDSWFVGHFWTLALEEQFYLLWPVALAAGGLAFGGRVAVAIVLAAPFVRVATYFAWPAARGQLGMMLHTAADPIMVGCLAALWRGDPRFDALLDRAAAWPWPAAAAAFLFGASPFLASRFAGAYGVTIGLSADALAVAFVLLWVVRNPSSVLTRCLSTSWLRRVGVLSYGLYLWQQLFLTPRNASWLGVFPLNLAACFAAAGMSYWAVEAPFLRLRDRLRCESAAAGSTAARHKG